MREQNIKGQIADVIRSISSKDNISFNVWKKIYACYQKRVNTGLDREILDLFRTTLLNTCPIINSQVAANEYLELIANIDRNPEPDTGSRR